MAGLWQVCENFEALKRSSWLLFCGTYAVNLWSSGGESLSGIKIILTHGDVLIPCCFFPIINVIKLSFPVCAIALGGELLNGSSLCVFSFRSDVEINILAGKPFLKYALLRACQETTFTICYLESLLRKHF
jgi:hypothetical protein